MYTFVYHVDEMDEPDIMVPYKLEKSLTDYIRRIGKSLIINQQEFERLVESGEVVLHGSPSPSWLGVPLKTIHGTIGVIGIQDYKVQNAFTPNDLELLESVSGQVALAIEHKHAEQALRQSEDRYRTIFDHSPNGVFLYDNDLKITQFNKRYLEIVRSTSEQELGFDLNTIKQKNVLPYVKATLTGKSAKFEGAYHTTTTDVDLWVSAGFVPLSDDQGRALGGMCVIEDITDRKMAEQALRENQEHLTHVASNVSAIIWSADIDQQSCDFHYTLITENVFKVTGYQMEDFLQPTSDFPLNRVHEEDRQMVSDWRKLICHGENVSGVYRFYRKDDTVRWLYDFMTPVKNLSGQVIRVDGITFDHTDRILAEQALAEEKERLAVTLRSIGDAVISTDTDGRVVLMNPLAEKLTGWKLGEAKNELLSKIFRLTEENTGLEVENPISRVLKTNLIVESAYNCILTSRDGSQTLIAESAAPIRDRDSRNIGVVLVFRDISVQRQQEKEILRAQKLESLSILAGGIAHDFNNILTSILGNISMAKLYIEHPDRQEPRLEKAERATLLAKDLTQQLLTFSRGGAPVKKTASIKELIVESAQFALTGSNVSCEKLIDDDLLPVDIDEGQINQVIHNIVLNAVQAMPNGGIVRIRAENFHLSEGSPIPLQPGDYVMIQVQDEGPGIAPEHLTKIFDPYFTTKQKGTGLGLASSFSIVKKHDGFIMVESKQYVGSTFTVYLPASTSSLERAEKVESVLFQGEGRVLIMDDEEGVRTVAKDMLTFMGFKTDCAANGEEAFEMYKNAKKTKMPYDIVILDLTVPGGMGGLKTISILKHFDPNIIAIVSSGYSNDPVMADYKKYGFAAVVCKPYRIDELSSILNELLQAKKK